MWNDTYIDIQTVYNKKFNNNNEHEYEESMYSNKNYQAINYLYQM